MNTTTKNRIASAGFRRAVLFALIGALVMGVVVANTVTSTSLGGGLIKLGDETFSDDGDVAVSPKRIFKLRNIDAGPAVGDSPSGVVITNVLPQVNNTLVRNNFAYEFEVKESSPDTLGVGEDLKIEVYMDDGSTTTLLATLYTQGATGTGAVKGVTVTVDTGINNNFGEAFFMVITRQ